jgi:hypothetical protein
MKTKALWILVFVTLAGAAGAENFVTPTATPTAAAAATPMSTPLRAPTWVPMYSGGVLPSVRAPIILKSEWGTLSGDPNQNPQAVTDYYYLGKQINSLDELKKIIAPLHDPEANRLLSQGDELGAVQRYNALFFGENRIPPGNRQPITFRNAMEGMDYFYSGEKISGDQGLKSIISPVHNPKADRLLAKAGSEESFGMPLFVGGGGLVLVGGALFSSNTANINTGELDGWQKAGLGAALVGLTGMLVGYIPLEDSVKDRFNAVQSYNDSIHWAQPSSWNGNQLRGVRTQLLTFRF